MGDETPTPERFTLNQDNDSHWYVVPVSKQEEWNAWLSLNSDDERAWEPPAFARATGGSYSLVTFSDPEIA